MMADVWFQASNPQEYATLPGLHYTDSAEVGTQAGEPRN